MGQPAPSQPPPSPRAKHLALGSTSEPAHPRECKRVKAGDEQAVGILNRVMKRRGTSNVELSEVVGCPERDLRKVRSGDRRKPFKVGHIFAFDRRTALAIWAEVHVALLSETPHED